MGTGGIYQKPCLFVHSFDRFAFYVQNPEKSRLMFNGSSTMQHVIGSQNACIGVEKQMASETGVTNALELIFI